MINKIYVYSCNGVMAVRYKDKLVITEKVLDVIKETDKYLWWDNKVGKIHKDRLNSVDFGIYDSRGYYDKPSMEDYKQALIKHRQSQINLHAYKIAKLEQEIGEIATCDKER